MVGLGGQHKDVGVHQAGGAAQKEHEKSCTEPRRKQSRQAWGRVECMAGEGYGMKDSCTRFAGSARVPPANTRPLPCATAAAERNALCCAAHP